MSQPLSRVAVRGFYSVPWQSSRPGFAKPLSCYRGWRVVFAPYSMRLDLAALQQVGYWPLVLSHN